MDGGPDIPAASLVGIEVRAPAVEGVETVLTDQALAFIVALEREFGAKRRHLLLLRAERRARIDAGERPDFLPGTADIRAGDWSVAPIPRDLLDRRVELTGPVERKMVINALNSGASCFMADFEDATAPTWENLIQGHINLRDAVAGTITFDDPAKGKSYRLGDKPAVMHVRPRGLHLPEKHVLVDGAPMTGALFDFGLFFFHNARALMDKGTGPYFYLPKLETHLEARWWNDVFVFAQEALGVPKGTIRATVLIETILATFEADEILYELREHSAGLNCGRWDYIFSYIKIFKEDSAMMLPDRVQVTMDAPFLRAYSLYIIKICHKREVHAIGGMAAQIPIKRDPEASAKALAKVTADKEREAADGHDGTWVAHPGLVGLAMAAFAEAMPEPNQIARKRPDVHVKAADLLAVPTGTITEVGLRHNVNVAICYIEAWLRGVGCVPLYDLMEDAATAEISRAQVWQWLHHRARLDDGRAIDLALVERVLTEELDAIAQMVGKNTFAAGRYHDAAKLFRQLVVAREFAEFLTLPAYELID